MIIVGQPKNHSLQKEFGFSILKFPNNDLRNFENMEIFKNLQSRYKEVILFLKYFHGFLCFLKKYNVFLK